VSVRVSPISRTAAILIIALGVFTLFAGVVADVQSNEVVGVAVIVLGLVLYRLLYRFTKKVESEIEGARQG
jgi:membrane protein implicated in regulation of membrane protease activity